MFRSLRRNDLQKVVDDIRESGKSAAVAEKVKQLYGQLYKWAIAEHIVLTNLAPSVVIISGALSHTRMRIGGCLIDWEADCSGSLYILSMSLSVNTHGIQLICHLVSSLPQICIVVIISKNIQSNTDHTKLKLFKIPVTTSDFLLCTLNECIS